MTEIEKEMTIEEKVDESIKKKKPLTKRDVAKFIGGRAAAIGGMCMTDSVLVPVAFEASKVFKHRNLMLTAFLWTTYCASVEAAVGCQALGEKTVDEICDLIIKLDDIHKIGVEIKEDKKKEREASAEEAE